MTTVTILRARNRRVKLESGFGRIWKGRIAKAITQSMLLVTDAKLASLEAENRFHLLAARPLTGQL